MATRLMDEKAYAAHQAKVKKGSTVGPHYCEHHQQVVAKKRPKYGNEAEIVDGIRMMSRKEAKRYRDLGLLLKGRQIDFLARQVRFLLPGGIEFVADFVTGRRTKSEFTQEYTIEVSDAKGVRNRVYINKAKQMLSEYGIVVIEV